MANSIFQKLYDKIKEFKTPDWLSAILYEIQMIVWSITLAVGKEYVNSLKDKIIEVAQLDISNEEKFKMVWEYGMSFGVEIKDRYLRLLIESIYNYLKEKEIVK